MAFAIAAAVGLSVIVALYLKYRAYLKLKIERQVQKKEINTLVHEIKEKKLNVSKLRRDYEPKLQALKDSSNKSSDSGNS